MIKGLVSVIVPVYNCESFLTNCLETIVAQTYKELEVILVDDGSTDGSASICDRYTETDSRFVVIHQDHLGLGCSRNVGQKRSRGEFIAFIDADDYIHKDYFFIMVNAVQANEEYDICIIDNKKTYSLNEDTQGEDKRENEKIILSQEDIVGRMFAKGESHVPNHVWGKLYRRSVVENVWSENYSQGQDEDYNLKVYLRARKAVWLRGHYYYYYYQHSSSTVHSKYYSILYGECSASFLYSNYLNLPDNKRQYSHYLLRKLYNRIAFLKVRIDGHEREAEIIKKCREYELATRKAYLKNPDIPFFEKIGVLVLLHNKMITKWFMLMTNNLG